MTLHLPFTRVQSDAHGKSKSIFWHLIIHRYVNSDAHWVCRWLQNWNFLYSAFYVYALSKELMNTMGQTVGNMKSTAISYPEKLSLSWNTSEAKRKGKVLKCGYNFPLVMLYVTTKPHFYCTYNGLSWFFLSILCMPWQPLLGIKGCNGTAQTMK